MSDLNFSNIKERYDRDGFVFFESLLPDDLYQQIREDLPYVLSEEGPQRFFEDDESTVRAVYGLHRKPDPWKAVSEHSIITRIAQFLIGEEVYIFQWKINPKAARSGGRWEWHRDFTFWHREDGIPTSNALTAAIFLDDVTEENGPLQLIPSSHSALTSYEQSQEPQRNSVNRTESNWSALVSSNMAHVIPSDVAGELAENLGAFKATGPAGSVVFFHSRIVHGSMPNKCDKPRTLGFITYNAVSNVPDNWDKPRPDFFTNLAPSALPPVL